MPHCPAALAAEVAEFLCKPSLASQQRHRHSVQCGPAAAPHHVASSSQYYAPGRQSPERQHRRVLRRARLTNRRWHELALADSPSVRRGLALPNSTSARRALVDNRLASVQQDTSMALQPMQRIYKMVDKTKALALDMAIAEQQRGQRAVLQGHAAAAVSQRWHPGASKEAVILLTAAMVVVISVPAGLR